MYLTKPEITTAPLCWGEREQLRIAPLVLDLHDLGPRPLYEFIRELVSTDHVLAVDVEEQLRRYARLDPQHVAALDGRDLRPPLAVIDGGRS